MREVQTGVSLVETLVLFAVAMTLAATGVPPLLDWSSGLRVDLAAGEMLGVMHQARGYAARYNVKVAVKFRTEPGGIVTHALYRDGDGDGVRSADIASGADPEVRPPRRLAYFGRRVRFGFPRGRAPRDPSDPRRRLDRLEDPIRFNRSDLASFGPRGTSTPGDGVPHRRPASPVGDTGQQSRGPDSGLALRHRGRDLAALTATHG